LSFIPRRDQAAGIFEDLRLCRALCGRFLLGGCGALRLHLAAIESHLRDRRRMRWRVNVCVSELEDRPHREGLLQLCHRRIAQLPLVGR
jgi:hypothetical protein